MQNCGGTQAQDGAWPAYALKDRFDPGGQGGAGPVAGFDCHATSLLTLLEVLLQSADTGEFRVGPLFKQLTHHPALSPIHGAIGRIAPVPVSYSQQAARFEHPQQLIGVALLVGHMGTGLHTPDGINAGVGNFQGQGIHHRKAAAEAGWS